MAVEYPMSPQGVFLTCQGEGSLIGTPMIFIRLAGCDVGCPACDTDYSVHSKMSLDKIIQTVISMGDFTDWVFITGGEPTIHDLDPLISESHRAGFKVGLATAGERKVQEGFVRNGVEYLYVSPHNPDKWIQMAGTDLNIVPGLNNHCLEDFNKILEDFNKTIENKGHGFSNKFVTPCEGKPETIKECLEWVHSHCDWRMGVQAHKTWGIS